MNSGILKYLERAISIIGIEDVFKDILRLKYILKDLCPTLGREISVISALGHGDIAFELYQEPNPLTELFFFRICHRFASATGYDRKTSEWCVLVWCETLEKKLEFNYDNIKYPSPVISTFAIDKEEVVCNDKVIVTWSVENATNTFLVTQGQSIEVPPTDTCEMTIESDQTISLIAVGFFQMEIRETRYVKAIFPVNILVFDSDSNAVVAGTPVLLHWKVENASAIRLLHSNVDYGPTGETIVFPLSSTAYTLIAENKAGAVSASVTINVIRKIEFGRERLVRLPQLTGFTFKQRRELLVPKLYGTVDNYISHSTRRQFSASWLSDLRKFSKKFLNG